MEVKREVYEVVANSVSEEGYNTLTFRYEGLESIQHNHQHSTFILNTKGKPLFAEGWMCYNDNSCSRKIPGVLNNPKSYVDITVGTLEDQRLCVYVTTDDSKIHELGCHGEITLYYLPPSTRSEHRDRQIKRLYDIEKEVDSIKKSLMARESI